MSAATAPITDVFGTGSANADGSRDRKKITSQFQTQCKPMPPPALGTQKIIQGNGTSVGTVISLQCPDQHKLVGEQFTCIMDTNSSHWVGEPYCRPLTSFEIHGFRVAIWASVVSSVIILILSIAFITCCMLECMNKEKKKRTEREQEMWQQQEQAQHHGNHRSHLSHKSRNNNNNNGQDKTLSLWDYSNPAVCDSMQACRCYQQHACAPACTYGHAHPLSALPGHEYTMPLVHQNPECAEMSGPPHPYIRSPQSSFQNSSPGPDHGSATCPGSARQYGGQHRTLTALLPSNSDETNTGNTNSAREFSIRIISV